MVLKDLYRNKYPVQEDLVSLNGRNPCKTHKTTWVSQEDAAWLTASVGGPAHFMAPSGGFSAGCLVHCEMYGLAGLQVTAMTDGHSLTAESMQAFKPVLTKLGLPDDVDNISSHPEFRPVVREANQRSNTIFS